MLPCEVTAVVDRLEGDKVVLRLDEGGEVILPRRVLGPSAREGAVIALMLTERPERESSLRDEILALQRELLDRSSDKDKA